MKKKQFTVTINNKYVDVEAKRKEFKNFIICTICAITCIPLLFLSQNLNTSEVQEDSTERQIQTSSQDKIKPKLSTANIVKKSDTERFLLSSLNTTIEESTTGNEETITDNPNVLDNLKKKSSSIDDTKKEKPTEKATTEIITTENINKETETEKETAKKVKTTKKKKKNKSKEKKKNNKEKYRYNCSDYEFNILLNIVEAEVTGENPKGLDHDTAVECKLRVAQVILNRVENPKFKQNTIESVVFAPNQFSPTIDGRYGTLKISKATKEACKKAILKSTKDYTDGSTYFTAGSFSWATYHFTDPVGHSFYTY